VADRYADHSIVSARSATLLPTIGAFTRAYDEVRQGDIPWARDAVSGRPSTYELVATARMWFPLLVRDIPGIDRSNFLDSVISDDIVDDVGRIISLLREGRGMDGEPMPYRSDAIERLDAALRAAQTQWLHAEAADLAYAERMNALRWKAVSFRAELEWFAQSVAHVLDHNASDYLRLLPSRAWYADKADDRGMPQPEIVEPATLVTGVPRMHEA
jgi:hypothetical protein